VNWDLEWDQQS